MSALPTLPTHRCHAHRTPYVLQDGRTVYFGGDGQLSTCDARGNSVTVCDSDQTRDYLLEHGDLKDENTNRAIERLAAFTTRQLDPMGPVPTIEKAERGNAGRPPYSASGFSMSESMT